MTPSTPVRVTPAPGETVPAHLRVGDTLEVVLPSLAGGGYLWAAVEVPACVRAAGIERVSTSADPAIIGSAGLEVLRFTAMAAGEGMLRLACGRPWEAAPPPSAVVAILVEASVPSLAQAVAVSRAMPCA